MIMVVAVAAAAVGGGGGARRLHDKLIDWQTKLVALSDTADKVRAAVAPACAPRPALRPSSCCTADRRGGSRVDCRCDGVPLSATSQRYRRAGVSARRSRHAIAATIRVSAKTDSVPHALRYLCDDHPAIYLAEGSQGGHLGTAVPRPG